LAGKKNVSQKRVEDMPKGEFRVRKNPITTILSVVYRGIVGLRNAWYDYVPRASHDLGRLTVSVGGIHAGGTGKTPMVLLIGEILREMRRPVAVLSRGYGRMSNATIVVDPAAEISWREIGDEPAMLRRSLPTAWFGIGGDRVDTARLLANRLSSESVFLLDDGFQHRRAGRNRDVVCLPHSYSNEKMLPAGYLREPHSSLKRAHAVVFIGGDHEQDALEAAQRTFRCRFPRIPSFVAVNRPRGWVNAFTGETRERPPLVRPLLLAGIAHPERFRATVVQTGVPFAGEAFYPDHYPYTEEELISLSGDQYDGILTTEKDAIRIMSQNLVKRPIFWYLSVRLEFCGTGSLKKFRNLLFAQYGTQYLLKEGHS